MLAHRGGAGVEFENSAAAIDRSVALGVSWIETDVRATRDGHCLLFHDATLDRTTNAQGRLAGLSMPELAEVVLRNGEPLLPLGAALARWPATFFNIDIKDDRAVLPFLRTVAAAGAWERVCAASFSARRLTRLRRWGGPALRTSASPREVAAVVLGLPLRAVSPPIALQVPPGVRGRALVTAQFVRAAHRRGLAVHVWTVDDPAQMAALLALGVDGIVTDHPARALQALESHRGAGGPGSTSV
ncbi:MAG: glycerophosphodiester phosphodiesterase family protein [Candidatus Nanopelagicales bacterium]